MDGSLHPSALVAFALALGLAAASPGPGIVALVAHTIRVGLRRCLPFVIGMIVGDLVFLILALSGLALIAATMGGLFLALKLVGAAWLVVLGIRAWRAPAQPVDTTADAPSRPLGGFLAGLLVILGNPKTMLFYMAVLPTVLDLRVVSEGDAAAAVVIAVVVNFAVLASYGVMAARARRLFHDGKAVRRLNRTAGAVMVGAGVSVAVR